ncbi:MAG TPA: hypothetical protein VGY98_15745 [Verrucomicrobiae bacterium]|nr:hypothetical protein [Verrucomicrobiae bacterium]
MKNERDMGFRPRVIGFACLYLFLGAAGFFLAFCNLDGRLFWADEAENAVLAKNIVKFGVPKVDDGLNHISLHGDRFDERDGVWTWSPWLPEYVTAASFVVFGETTWDGRAPFAFIGWLAVAVLGVAAWKIYRSHRVTLAAMLLLGTSEVFLLHIRQCRYYSITVFAEILLFCGIYKMLTKSKMGGGCILAALTLQFYCNYTIAAANIPLLLVLAWNLFREEKSLVLPVMVSLGILFVLTAPWLLYSEVWRQGAAEPHDPWFKTLWFYLVQFHFYFLPWCVVLLPVYGWLSKRFSNSPVCQVSAGDPDVRFKFESYLVLLPFLYTPVLLIMPGGYLRYLLPILPPVCLLVAVWLFRYVRWTVVAVGLLVVQCVSNVFSVATNPFHRQIPLRLPLVEFVFGMLSPYQDRFSDVLDYFQKHAKPGETVVSANPEFPLMFYTRLKIVNARLSPSPLKPLPEWILPVSLSDVFFFRPARLPESLERYYETIDLTVHDSPRVDEMPEPNFYQDHTTATMTQFVIYRRKGG